MNNSEKLNVLASRLRTASTSSIKTFIGFDGFVDEVVHVVKKRYDADNFDRVEYMADYGNMIASAAGVSLNVELYPVRCKIGGNGPILANSLISHGLDITYMGACGKGTINPVFEPLETKAHLISISDPAHTDAIEFLDGKIISCKLEPLRDVSWDNICKAVSKEQLAEMFENNSALVFANWTLVINSSDIWQHIIDDVLPNANLSKRKMLFVDLADPSKRLESDVLRAMAQLSEFGKYFNVVLGLNKREAKLIASYLGSKKELDTLPDVADYLAEHIGVSQVVVHTAKEACASSNSKGRAQVATPFCEKPKQSTGAGDSFNAGYILGQVLGYTLEESLQLATANAGFYIRNAYGGDKNEIADFLELWSNGKLQ